jgi:glucose/arabinose dehydrogenase
LRASALLIGVITSLLVGGAAGAAPPSLQLVEVASGFESPVYVASTNADPGAIYVVEQRGRVKRVVAGVTDPKAFLDITKKVRYRGEQGLLSVAFSPTYATDHLLYAYYVSRKQQVIVSRFSIAPTTAATKTRRSGKDGGKGSTAKEKVLLTVGHKSFDNHDGGQVAFGPDGQLYAGIGDGGGGGDPLRSGQNPSSKLGKLLRAAGPTFQTWQIVGYGLRNPWRFSFDSANGDLYIGDVGQGNREEIDCRPAASVSTPANYGWSRYEGTADFNTAVALDPPDTPATPLVSPVQEYDHSAGDCAVIGGYVYRGTAMPDEIGRYFYGDLCTGRVWSMAAGGGDNRSESITVNTPTSFGTDAAGELYVTSMADGKVYRVSE